MALTGTEDSAATGLIALSGSDCRDGIGTKPYMLRHRRWFGINAFTHVSDVFVQITPHDGIATHVFVNVDQLRAWRWVPYVAFLTGILYRGQPLWLLLEVMVTSTIIAWKVSVSFLGGSLIEKQLREALLIVAPSESDS